MQKNVIQCGGSRVVALPKKWLFAIELFSGKAITAVDMAVEADKLILRPLFLGQEKDKNKETESEALER